MIKLTKLNGEQLILNSDLIETIEERPDTTILLTNEKFILVRESAEEVVGKVIEFRRKLLAVPKAGTARKKKTPETSKK